MLQFFDHFPIDSKVAEFCVNSLSNIPFYGKPLRPQLAKGEQFDRGDIPFPSNPHDDQSYFRNGHQAPPPSWSNGPPINNYPPPPQHESYPSHHPLANLELGPGFGPNAANTKMASLPPPPASQEELRELIDKRMKLEMIHPYEKHLIETYDGNSKNTPQMHPPPEYLRLIRDRAILKVRLLRAQERSFDVYGTATQMFTQGSANANDPYGFEASNKVENRSAGLYDTATPNFVNASDGSNNIVASGDAIMHQEQQPPSSSYATAYGKLENDKFFKTRFFPRK